jgi:hypothetical protein
MLYKTFNEVAGYGSYALNYMFISRKIHTGLSSEKYGAFVARKSAKIVSALVRQQACAEKSASLDARTISRAQSSVKGKETYLRLGSLVCSILPTSQSRTLLTGSKEYFP